MFVFQCGHEECGTQCAAPSREEIMGLVKEHLKQVHNVDRTTESLLAYIESTCVTAQ